MQAQGGDPVLVQGDVESAVDVEARGEVLGAVAPHAARPPLPGRDYGAGAAPEGISMNAVLIVPKISLGVVANPEGTEDADLAASPGAEGVSRECGQKGVGREGGQGRLHTHVGPH